MSSTQGDLASLSRFIFRAPNWYASVGFSLLLAAIIGMAVFDSRFILEDAWQGIFFIGVPTLAASFLTTPVDRRLGGQLTYNRSSLLALSGEVLIVAILTVSGVITWFTPFGQQFVFDALIAGLALIFSLRLLVVMAVSRNSLPTAAVAASIQTVAAAVLLFIYSGMMRYFEIGGPLLQAILSRQNKAPAELATFVPNDLVLLAVLCVLYATAAYLFLVVIDRPWRRSLGISVLDFGRGFIGHIAEGSRELETFFEEIGEKAVVPVTVLSFRRPSGEEKARFVLPMIHPGPMGEIGGGNLPQRVASQAEGLAFPPHATAGHDFNLVTEREVDKLLATAESAYQQIEYSNEASRSFRARSGEANLLGQAFGDDALMVATYSPSFADDVEYAVGLSAAAEARSQGLDDVLLADAHNCNNGLAGDDLGHVYPGSERSFDMFQAAGALGAKLREAPRGRLRLGTAWDRTRWLPADGIGPLGIRVAVLAVEDHTTAYVLVDGNNMEPGLRERIVDALDAVDDAEVMTTDTHIVNMVKSQNQVGEAIDQDELIALVSSLVAEAIEDVEPVEAGMASERSEVIVFGNNRTETLASHANAMVTMGGALAAVVILATIAVSVIIFFFA